MAVSSNKTAAKCINVNQSIGDNLKLITLGSSQLPGRIRFRVARFALRLCYITTYKCQHPKTFYEGHVSRKCLKFAFYRGAGDGGWGAGASGHS